MTLDQLEALADAALAPSPSPASNRVNIADVLAIAHFTAAANPATIKELVQLVRQCKEALQTTNAAYEALAAGLQSDLERGGKFLNEKAAQKFKIEYPNINGAFESLLGASITTDETLEAIERWEN